MIISCNSCEKKFVVPDKAVSSVGRLVQCGSCGNKWTQYPTKKHHENIVSKNIVLNNEIKKKQTSRKRTVQREKKREIDLYSPEYLAKKHGIRLEENNYNSKSKKNKNMKISFGFYGYLLITSIFLIAFLKLIYFLKAEITMFIPFSEVYLDNLFESIKNLFEVWKDLISNY